MTYTEAEALLDRMLRVRAHSDRLLNAYRAGMRAGRPLSDIDRAHLVRADEAARLAYEDVRAALVSGTCLIQRPDSL
jgi:hypothetical protein